MTTISCASLIASLRKGTQEFRDAFRFRKQWTDFTQALGDQIRFLSFSVITIAILAILLTVF